MRYDEQTHEKFATQAIQYSEKSDFVYGLHRKHEPSCYGKLLKYLMAQRGYSFSAFADRLGVTTQTMNYRINAQKKKNYKQEEIEQYCRLLAFETDDFIAISRIIERMENGD